jgi:hypothetical protein
MQLCNSRNQYQSISEILSRAEQLGVHGAFEEFLRGLQKWLLNSTLSVCVKGVQGEPFATHRGTKQGGRLSPLCFGLFVEQIAIPFAGDRGGLQSHQVTNRSATEALSWSHGAVHS